MANMKLDEWIAEIMDMEGLVNSLREALTANEVLQRVTEDFGDDPEFCEDPFWDLIADGKADEAYAELNDCLCRQLKRRQP